MAKTTTELLTENAANFPDNTAGLITPALLRSMISDAVTSFAYGSYVNGNFTTQSGAINYCDTSAGSFNLTLPTSPAVGNIIAVRDLAGTWGTNNLNILPGANNIESVAGTFVCNTSDANFDLVWRDGGIGWSIQFVGIGGVSRIQTTLDPGLISIQGRSTVSFLGAVTATRGAMAAAGVSAVTWQRGGISVIWSATDKNANITLSGSNLIATDTTGVANVSARANTSNVGHKYFELTFTALSRGSNNPGIGLANSTASIADGSYFGQDANSVGFYCSGYVQGPGGSVGSANPSSTPVSGHLGPGFGVGDVLGVELLTDRTAKFYVNNVLGFTFLATPDAVLGNLYPGTTLCFLNDSVTANFGGSAFVYTPPAGATAWNL